MTTPIKPGTVFIAVKPFYPVVDPTNGRIDRGFRMRYDMMAGRERHLFRTTDNAPEGRATVLLTEGELSKLEKVDQFQQHMESKRTTAPVT